MVHAKLQGGRRLECTDRPRSGYPPLLTIITVVYNGALTLRPTVESVVTQQCDFVEYIVIDGGSDDGTLDIIREYEDKIDYWVSEPDSGIYDAMNKGITISTGKYLLFLNAQDELAVNPRELETFLLQDHVLLYGKANMREPDGRLVYVKGKEIKSASKFVRGMPLCHQSVFYKRDEIGGYDTSYKIIADRVLTYNLLKKHGLHRAFFINKVIVDYFEGGFSRQNYERWRNEEVTFLCKNGNYFYAVLRRVGYLYKKYSAIIRDILRVNDLLRLKGKS